MDRYTNQDASAFQPGKVTIDIEFVAGTSGAVPTALSGYVRADGISGMTLSATGVYLVALQDSYVGFTRGTFSVEQSTYDASHGCRGEVALVAVTSGTAPAVTFQCVRNDTGAAVAVTAGDIVRISLELTRQSAS